MTRQPHDPWHSAMTVLKTLRAHQHVAQLAGGCVRDRLLGYAPKDYDIATDATPAQVKQIFAGARKVGAKFGVMLVRRHGHGIEVATFRRDHGYSDGRHPDEVTFGTQEEDAGRRDFTINGLFFDPIEDRVIDYVGGRADLSARVIRTIGDPDRRFAEDHLRMLRAVRFAARLGFTIEPKTRTAIQHLAAKLGLISAERIWLELEQILMAPTRAVGWSLLIETGLYRHLARGWEVARDEAGRIQRRLDALPARPISFSLSLSAVLCPRAPDEVARICQALRLSNRMSKAVIWLVRSLPVVHEEQSLELADLKMLMAGTHWDELIELLRANLTASGDRIDLYERLCRRTASISGEHVSPPPLLSGDDLSAIGIRPGPQFGDILKALYRAQLNEQVKTRDEAIKMARRLC